MKTAGGDGSGATGNTLSLPAFGRMPPSARVRLIREGWTPPTGRAARARALVLLGRPRTCFVGVLAYVLGYSLVAGGWGWRPTAAVVVTFLIAFVGNAHNALADLEEDANNLPGRLLLVATTGSRLLRRAVSWSCAGMLALAASVGAIPLVIASLAVAGLLQYSSPPVRAKNRPVVGLLIFSQAVGVPFALGLTTPPPNEPWMAFPDLASGTWASAVALFLYLTSWFVAKGHFKNVPDYDGDRAAAVRTSATVFASRREAARAAVAATATVYAGLVLLVVTHCLPQRAIGALVWAVPATLNAARLLDGDGRTANEILKRDMLISVGFLATLLALVEPGARTAAVVAVSAVAIAASDLLGIDSRSTVDVDDTRAGAEGSP